MKLGQFTERDPAAEGEGGDREERGRGHPSGVKVRGHTARCHGEERNGHVCW